MRKEKFFEAERLFRDSKSVSITTRSAFSASAFNWNINQAQKLRQEISALKMQDWYSRMVLSIAKKKSAGSLQPDEIAIATALDLSQKKQFDAAAKVVQSAIQNGNFAQDPAKQLTAELLVGEIICDLKDFERGWRTMKNQSNLQSRRKEGSQ